MRQHLCKNRVAITLILALGASFSAPVAAAVPPFNFKGIYDVRLAGVPIGRIGFESEQSASHYTMTSDIKSSGIANIFSNHSSHTVVDGSGKNYIYPEAEYDTHYQTKKKKRSVKMSIRNGEFTAEEVVPPDNRSVRPAVPADIKKGSVDPLTLIMETRRMLADALEKNAAAFTLKTYDGRRLTQINAAIVKKRTITYNKKPLPVTVIGVRRLPLAGFTESEIDDYSPKEPTLYMYFTDDERLVPVKLELSFMFGTLAATLVKECLQSESCQLGNRD